MILMVSFKKISSVLKYEHCILCNKMILKEISLLWIQKGLVNLQAENHKHGII